MGFFVNSQKVDLNEILLYVIFTPIYLFEHIWIFIYLEMEYLKI